VDAKNRGFTRSRLNISCGELYISYIRTDLRGMGSVL